MHYSISGLPVEPFRPLFGLSERELALHHVVRVTAYSALGFPCRVLLEDAAPGDTLLLLNHEYQSADTPYRGRHAIFVNEAATAPRVFIDKVPPVLAVRQSISLRAFDREHMMIDAHIVAGSDVEAAIMQLFVNAEVSYIHAHNAGRGCFAARVDRGAGLITVAATSDAATPQIPATR